MSDIHWIKLSTSMFDDEKIDFIMSLPDADAIVVIWVRLLTMAGRCNAGGFLMLTEKIPYTDEMMANKFRKPLNTVRLALRTFAELEMIDQDGSGAYHLSNWEKHQSTDKLDTIREQNRVRQQRFRKGIPAPTCNVTVTEKDRDSNDTEVELEVELEQEEEQDNTSGDVPSPVVLTPDKKKRDKPIKHKHGSEGNILLTDKELATLKDEFPNAEEAIEYLSVAKAMKGYKYQSDYLALRKWVFRALEDEKRKTGTQYRNAPTHSKTSSFDDKWKQDNGAAFERATAGKSGPVDPLPPPEDDGLF